MNPFIKIWFWLLILSIITLIIFIIVFERYGQTNNINSSTPVWVWVIFALAVLFWIVALILYAVDVVAYKKRMEMAEACGEELPPTPPKKKIECIKTECREKKIIECVERKPCEYATTGNAVGAVFPVTPIPVTSIPVTPIPVTPISVTSIPVTQEHIVTSAATIKPLSSLAPMSGSSI